MSDNKKESNSFGQIFAAVVITLVAGGTSPWWWDKFFESNSQSPEVVQTNSPSEPSPTSSEESDTPSDIDPNTDSSGTGKEASQSSPTDNSTENSGATPIRWPDTIRELKISKSKDLEFTFECPSGDEKSNYLYGTDIYTGDSSICEAAVHAGIITREQGGLVTIKVGGSRQSFLGSQSSGVLSKERGPYSSSFTIVP